MIIRYSDKATKQLKRILKGSRPSALDIIATIEAYGENPLGNFDESFEQRLILVGGMDFHRKILKGNAERGFRVCPWIPCLL
ncbi:MAG TPA: hypothetical protein PLF52_02335 [Syntrophales bacterium]|nr:hypothetical protein [Syntrophales bacterium]